MIAEEWIEQGAQALYELHPEGYQKPLDQRHAGDSEHVEAAAVLAEVVPLILADKVDHEDWNEVVMVLGDALIRTNALWNSVMALRPDESGRISKGLVLAMIKGEVT
jgi:hypothetical protein